MDNTKLASHLFQCTISPLFPPQSKSPIATDLQYELIFAVRTQ